MSVQVNCVVSISSPSSSFNTSYVSVQVAIADIRRDADRFQYILCVGSRYESNNCNTLCLVSIHLMCRFKKRGRRRYYNLLLVSIHLMCRFKRPIKSKQTSYARFQYILCVGSSRLLWDKWEDFITFQYILCVGSRR